MLANVLLSDPEEKSQEAVTATSGTRDEEHVSVIVVSYGTVCAEEDDNNSGRVLMKGVIF